MKNVAKSLDEEHGEIAKAIWAGEDTIEFMPSKVKEVNERLEQVMEEKGITKKHFKDSFFKEFNIMDMYTNGKLCYTCYKGKRCEKHNL